MADQNKNPIYNISVNYLDNQFYITPLVRMPPAGLRTEVLPLYTAADNNFEKFVEAIECAKLQSDVRYNQNVSDREEWDGDNEKIWNTAQKSWDIFWEEDGSVSIGFSKPYVKHRNGVEWINVPEAKKSLAPNTSSSNIAVEILKQAKAQIV